MNNINYNDRSDGEVTVTGCYDCPFLHYEERSTEYKPYCSIDKNIQVEIGDIFLKKYFPEKCKLRKPNFKLTRKF